MRGGEERGAGSRPARPTPSPRSRVRRKKLTDIWEELKSEREKRVLLEVGGVRVPCGAGVGWGWVAGTPQTPSLH